MNKNTPILVHEAAKNIAKVRFMRTHGIDEAYNITEQEWEERAEQFEKEASAALGAISGMDMKIVPTEPTASMLMSANDEWPEVGKWTISELMDRAYRAMIEVVPQPGHAPLDPREDPFYEFPMGGIGAPNNDT